VGLVNTRFVTTLFRRSAVLLLAALLLIGIVVAPARWPFGQAQMARAAVIQTLNMALDDTSAVPNPVINYQGRLLNPTTGFPLSDGSYQIAFRLYNVETGGADLWSEAYTVPVNRSIFTVLLGSLTPLDPTDFNGQPLWLGITVGTDPEMTPRQRIAHTPYAMLAERVKDNAVTSASIADGSVTSADIADESIGAGDLAGGSVGASEIAANSVDSGRIVNGSILAADLAAGVGVNKFISLDVSAIFVVSPAFVNTGYGPNAGIHLPDGSNGNFYTGFTLPPDYTSGTTINGKIVWHTSATNCGIEFSPNATSVSRVGRTHILGSSVTSGLTTAGSTLANGGTANLSNLVQFSLTSPQSSVPLQAGDNYIFSLYRAGNSGSDTCAADMVIQGISLTYQ
jgi:hypothetical protein